MESYEQCGQGRSYCSLCTLDTIHRLVFVTRLIINKINKVQWVDFKLENVLVSLHSLKTMGLGSIIFKKWRVTWTFSYTDTLANNINFGDIKGVLSLVDTEKKELKYRNKLRRQTWL